jgi:hypothetical protein
LKEVLGNGIKEMFGNLTILMQNHLKPLSTMEGVNHGRHHDGVYNSTQHDH